MATSNAEQRPERADLIPSCAAMAVAGCGMRALHRSPAGLPWRCRKSGMDPAQAPVELQLCWRNEAEGPCRCVRAPGSVVDYAGRQDVDVRVDADVALLNASQAELDKLIYWPCVHPEQRRVMNGRA
ncbi:hypothetical protein MHYP_G00183920 [Metynnis hypsauchen]